MFRIHWNNTIYYFDKMNSILHALFIKRMENCGGALWCSGKASDSRSMGSGVQSP